MFLRHELLEIAHRPTLWLGALAMGMLLVFAAARMDLEGRARIKLYYQSGDAKTDEIHRRVTELIDELSNVEVVGRAVIRPGADLAEIMARDRVDIAISRHERWETSSEAVWRITVRSRSLQEHARLVRISQLLGATINRGSPWFVLAYTRLYEDATDLDAVCYRARELCAEMGDKDISWDSRLKDVRERLCEAVQVAEKNNQLSRSCSTLRVATRSDPIQISGLAADPGSHARTFVPRVISLFALVVAFAFCCRSMIADISSNTLPVLLVASHGAWMRLAMAKVVAAAMFGMLVLVALLAFAAVDQSFFIKSGLALILPMQGLALVIAGLTGTVVALLGRSEARIYLLASLYVVGLIMLSGFFGKIGENEVVLKMVSSMLPLRFAFEPLEAWMVFGVAPLIGGEAFNTLVAQLMAVSAALVLIVARLRRTT